MINYFNFKQFSPEHLLITNDFGAYAFITKNELRDLIRGNLDSDSELQEELVENGFAVPSNSNFELERLFSKYRNAKSYLFQATGLHIFVLTNECNLNCVYCQARDHVTSSPLRMGKDVAEKAVDIALQSPAKSLNFEFQGGEPLLNFDVLRHIVQYAEEKKRHHSISYSVVTNLTLLTEEMLTFFEKYKINISTSLDGNCETHDANRIYRNGTGSFEKVSDSIKRVKARGLTVGAIQTTTRASLSYPEKIIDTYMELGFNSIFIRPLTKLGTAVKEWENIGYSAEDFKKFYKKCIEYIIKLNKEGVSFQEGHAGIFLSKILHGRGQNYMELRSPCGAAVGQVAYYSDGNVYTCDEGRMLAEMGDCAFKLGSVFDNTYEEILSSPTCKAVCASSILECIPECADCVYQPYCGVCPVLNYSCTKNIFKREARGYKCETYKGMLDVLFEILYLNDEQDIEILRMW